VTRCLPAVLALVVTGAPGCRLSAAPQATGASGARFEKRVVTTGLENPFQIVWGPDDHLWITERTAGRVTRVRPPDGSKTVAIAIGDVLADGPGGLLGMALDPGLLKGTANDHVYVAYTYDGDADPKTVSPRTKIVRFTYDPRTHTLGNAKDVLTGLPAGTDHQGGRLVIGPDRKLYFTIGDLGANQLANFCNPNRAQILPTVAQVDKRDWSLYVGKILRLNPDGSIPSDNPTLGGVRSHIYSYGHRNPQGLVFAPDGKLYESEHGPNTDDEVNLIRAGANYGWPHVAGYRDDQSYAYANWSASKDVPCTSLTYTAYPEVPPSVPVQKESAWNHEFVPPIQTFRTVPTGYDFKNPKCAERELYYQCWPTAAPSSLAVYTAKNGIPGWDHSLLMPSLKHGTVYRMQLDAAGTAVVGEPDENMRLKTVNRYRDVTMRPDGLALFIVTDIGGNTQDASGRPAVKVENAGAILEFRYLSAQQAAAAPALPDVQKLGPQVGERVPDFALNDQHGQPRTLTSLTGPKGLVLVFYRSADW
jgi:PQQ-dependent dehydrogenase (s-GDH family)